MRCFHKISSEVNENCCCFLELKRLVAAVLITQKMPKMVLFEPIICRILQILYFYNKYLRLICTFILTYIMIFCTLIHMQAHSPSTLHWSFSHCYGHVYCLKFILQHFHLIPRTCCLVNKSDSSPDLAMSWSYNFCKSVKQLQFKLQVSCDFRWWWECWTDGKIISSMFSLFRDLGSGICDGGANHTWCHRTSKAAGKCSLKVEKHKH